MPGLTRCPKCQKDVGLTTFGRCPLCGDVVAASSAGPVPGGAPPPKADPHAALEARARAEIAWGYPVEAVRKRLLDGGLPRARVDAIVASARAGLEAEVKRLALRDLAVGGGLVLCAVAVVAIFASGESARGGAKGMAMALLALGIGGWRLGTGIMRLVQGARGESQGETGL